MNLAKGLQYPQTLNMSQHIAKGCREIYAKYLFQLNFFEKLRKSGISSKFATFAQYYSVCLSLAWRTSFYIHFFLYCICTCGLVILIQFPDLLSLRNGRITTTNKQGKTTTKCLSSLITSCGPSRLATSRPHKFQGRVVFGREAAERATKSQEVDLSRLKAFHLRFTPRTRSGVTCNGCLR